MDKRKQYKIINPSEKCSGWHYIASAGMEVLNPAVVPLSL
jgi:hypothetical protein